MRSSDVVAVVDILPQQPVKIRPGQNDHMVEKLAAQGAGELSDIWGRIMVRGAWNPERHKLRNLNADEFLGGTHPQYHSRRS